MSPFEHIIRSSKVRMESSKKFTPLLVEAPIIYTWGSVPVVGFHNIWGWRHMKSFFNARGRSLASTKKKKKSLASVEAFFSKPISSTSVEL